MRKFKKSTINLLWCCWLISPSPAFSQNESTELKLHYDSPASYFEESLVIGNGSMGACVYSGTQRDKISLNDITLWTGEPDKVITSPDAHKAIPEIRSLLEEEKYEAAERAMYKVQGHYSENYQPLGTLTISYPNHTGEISAYQRNLNISNAIVHVEYRHEGSLFQADYFASAPDSVIVIKLQSEAPGGIQAILSYESLLPHSTKADGNDIFTEGYAAYHSYPGYYDNDNKFRYDPERGIHFKTIVRVLAEDGAVRSFPSGQIKISGCKEALILIANATSFNGFNKDPFREGRNYQAAVTNRMENAAAKNYQALRKSHIEDYKHYFDRVKINLGKTDSHIATMSTDKQLRLYTDKQQRNPELETLYFQYGRYLLISSSRTRGVPANLQGLWNEKLLPPWSSNYTTNINLEENYWAAETANLSEMHQPLMDYLSNLSQTGNATAKAYYGVDEGWCLAHNSDIWAMTCPVGENGGDPSWACWNMGGAWLSTHIWEHFLFTQDKQFLLNNYHILKGAATFCMKWLIEKDGCLITSPGTSPENKYLMPNGYVGATSYGNTSDLAMIRECLTDTYEAASRLNTDKRFRQRIKQTLKWLFPYQIGKNGNLQEWYYDWQDQDPKHRHQSHLFGLYPGHQITLSATPELAKACARTLEIKGDETTGWSTGWRINLYARLRDGQKAYHTLRKLLKYISPDNYNGSDAKRGGGTYPNLLDAHSPFQIDGNFGGCAGVIEMLVQSTANAITLLPALPKQWESGTVEGICARGGFVVNMSWKEGKVYSLTITSKRGGETKVFFNGTSKCIKLKAQETCTIL